MSGRCSPRLGKITTWTSKWDLHSAQGFETSDSVSQISDSTVEEQNTEEVCDVKQRLRKLFEDQLYTDVLFYPKDDPTASISAHRALLAVGSPLFAKMLFDDQENDIGGMKVKVQISNMAFEAFSNIVKYLYTDDIFFESDELVRDILEGAKQFQIQSLVDRCMSYLENQELTEQNVCSKFQMSVANEIETLKNRCIKYIQENTRKVIKSSDFQKCSSNTVRVICKLPSLNLRSEVELLEAIMSWLNTKPVDGSKQQQIEPLLKYIRFLNFTVNELGNVLKQYPDLLTPKDGLQIMMYLNNPSSVSDFQSLPAWCNKNTTSRCLVVDDSQSSQAGRNRHGDHSGQRVIFPLKESFNCQNFSKLTSLLQMKCIMGYHQIRAIKLSFQEPVNDRSVIKSLSIVVHVSPSGFVTRENIEIANSLDVRIAFTKVIKARRGDMLGIEVEAKNFQGYTFLQFDDASDQPNPHFQCCVASRPKVGRLFFISEVEYGPQVKQGNKNNRRFQRRFR